MSKECFIADLQNQIDEMQQNALLKSETVISSPQAMKILTDQNEIMINFCANNYCSSTPFWDAVVLGRKYLNAHFVA